jgi:hypothetical protein
MTKILEDRTVLKLARVLTSPAKNCNPNKKNPASVLILVGVAGAFLTPTALDLPGPDGCTGHSFDLWPDVSAQAIAFLNSFLQTRSVGVPGRE